MAERSSKAFFDALDKKKPKCPFPNDCMNPLCEAARKEKTMTRDAGSTCQCNENADDKLRIGIYREAWKDAEEACRLAKKLADGKTQDNDRLRVENEKLWAINTEKNNLIAELQQRVLTLEGHKARYQQEILQLEQECETYRLALHSIAKTAESVGLE